MERRFPAPGRQLCGLAWDGSRLWHSDAGTATIYALDPVTGAVHRELACPGVRTDLTWTGEHLVQVVGVPKRLCYLEPTGSIVSYRSVEHPSHSLCGLDSDGGLLWMGFDVPGAIQLRAAETLAILREFPVEGEVAGLTYVPGAVLYADYVDGVIRSVDPQTGEVRGRRRVNGSPTGLTWDGAHVWYCDYDANEICAIDPDGLC